VTDLACVHELAHRAPRVFDRHGGVHPVLVVEIDMVDTQAFEGCIAGSVHVIGVAVHADP
jgi:hypothetical protein